MTAAVLYARYSTAMQSAASVEDQLRLLRQRAAREGWTIAGEHADRAISGTVRQRPGLVAALAMIERGEAQILLAESLDRISRDQEDIAGIYKRVRFNAGRIVTLSEGEASAIHIGMGGTMSAIFLEQLGEKVRRGQLGRVAAGRIPGGLSYGYCAVRTIGADGELERGLREIDEDQAAIVRRIFQSYADGLSPRAIALQLNKEGIAAPRGGPWRANAIGGHRARGNGILHNQLYAGRIVYNRQTFCKDPETRKRVARANPAEAVTVHDMPDLRIVEPELWDRVQALLASHADKPAHQARRPRRLLSGLLRCGQCGGSVIIISLDRWGCSNKFQTGGCSNGVTLSNRLAEKRVWAAIDQNLLHPAVLAAYLDELRLAMSSTRRERIAGRAQAERRLAAIDAEEERLVDAIVGGFATPKLKERSLALAAERAQLEAELAEQPALDGAAVHPAMVERYKREVAALHELKPGDRDVDRAARELLTTLVTHIDMRPYADGRRGADLELHGDLAALLQIQKKPAGSEDPRAVDCTVKLVAGAGFGRRNTIRFAA